MGRSIYFTDLEIEKLIDYVSDSVELLGEAEGTREQTAEDMENGLGSAIRKLYKGRRGEKIYAKYKTKRGKGNAKTNSKSQRVYQVWIRALQRTPKAGRVLFVESRRRKG